MNTDEEPNEEEVEARRDEKEHRKEMLSLRTVYEQYDKLFGTDFAIRWDAAVRGEDAKIPLTLTQIREAIADHPKTKSERPFQL